MRLRNVKNAIEILEKSEYFVKNPEANRSNWSRLFNNDNPLMVEIGMGKGDFIIGMAKLHPEWNFVGIEAYESVLVRAVQKLEPGLPNLKVMRLDAKDIETVFAKEVDTIYLNFSDPWPKTRHHKRRLTHENFLKKYDNIYKNEAQIEIKTDNDGLFESSIVYLSNHGYIFDRISLDLWSTEIEDVKTEYEIKFSSRGYKIKFLRAHMDEKRG